MQLKNIRSLLFVPATATHLLPKARSKGADALIVDLEDSIPAERKVEARAMAANAIRVLHGDVPVFLRVNSQPDQLSGDVAAVPLDLLAGVMLPKVESAEQVRQLASLLADLAPEGLVVPIGVVIETARGVLNALEIGEAHASLISLGFGSEDYAAEMGVAPDVRSLAWPAQQVATSARACGLVSWGMPGSVAEVQDMRAYADLVAQARTLGFTGTVCIHPNQVSVANTGFGPSDDELNWAHRVVAADKAAREQGLGATIVDGKMVDLPIVERARRWIAVSRT